MLLRTNFTEKGILMSKADVSDASRNVRVNPDKAYNVCYTVGELVVIDFRLTFELSGSPEFTGVIWVAAKHARCNTTINPIQLRERKQTMAHVNVVDRREEGKARPTVPDGK